MLSIEYKIKEAIRNESFCELEVEGRKRTILGTPVLFSDAEVKEVLVSADNIIDSKWYKLDDIKSIKAPNDYWYMESQALDTSDTNGVIVNK